MAIVFGLIFSYAYVLPSATAYDPKNPNDVFEAQRNNTKARNDNAAATEGVEAMLVSVENEVDDIENSQIPAANAALEVSNQNLADAKEKAEKISKRLDAANSDKERIEKQLDIAEKNFDSSKVAVSALLREEMRNADQMQSLQLMINADDSQAFVENLETQAAASRTQSRLLSSSAFAKADAQTKEKRLEIVDQLIADLKRQADENELAAEKAQADAIAFQAQLVSLQAQLVTKKADLEVKKANLAAEKAQYEAEQKRIAADMAELAKNANNGFDGSGGYFARPIAGKITSHYGYAPDYIAGSFHKGVDFARPCGTPIYASADGEVNVAGMGWDPWGAEVVMINHGSWNGANYITQYAHMLHGGVYVSKGQWVTRGQQIGAVGMTGNASGCHLHFEIWKNGTQIDPASLIGY